MATLHFIVSLLVLWMIFDVGVPAVTQGPTTTLNPLCTTDDPQCTVHGHCIVDGTGKITSCKCDAGYSDPKCATDIDECTTSAANCDTQADCTNTDGSFTCTCKTGYTGNGVTCTDVDECTTGSSNCAAEATCTNTPAGSFTCACNAGYTGNGQTCTADGTNSNTADVDECTTGSSNCAAEATCTNTPAGSFTCACNAGYTGNGQTCTADGTNSNTAASTTTMDPKCVSYNCSGDHGSCHIVANNAACSCNEGYNGTACEKTTACLTHPCLHGTCSSNNATYRYCTCPEGFNQPDCNAGTTLIMTFTVLLLSVFSKLLLS